MIINVDYHFHPNLPKDDAKALVKCKRWWEEIQKVGVNCVLVTEHIYKNPQRSYEFMAKTKPKGCYCFPGMEYLSKEGIDLIIFSDKKNIFSHKELTPWNLDYHETMDFVLDKKLQSFVTHPFGLGGTAVFPVLGKHEYFLAANKLKAVEITNSTFDNLFALINHFPFTLVDKKVLKEIKMNDHVPKKYYPKGLKFLAAGSDSHQFDDLGTHFQIHVQKGQSIFNAIITNLDGKDVIKKKSLNLRELIVSGWITYSEYRTKMKYKRKMNK
jgi:hypothetical protein